MISPKLTGRGSSEARIRSSSRKRRQQKPEVKREIASMHLADSFHAPSTWKLACMEASNGSWKWKLACFGFLIGCERQEHSIDKLRVIGDYLSSRMYSGCESDSNLLFCV